MTQDARSPESTASGEEPHTLEAAHRDIEFGNSYRIEYIKHLVSISTGVFVFSVAFMKDLVGSATTSAHGRLLLLLGWCFLVLSVLAGIFHMRYWAWYYISWGTEWKAPRAQKWRAKINRQRKIAESTQIYGFVAGLLLLLAFAGWNLLI